MSELAFKAIVLMHADAFFLLGAMICALAILQRELVHAHIVVRAFVVFACAAAFGQAMWLLSMWVPSPAGYPIPRLCFDGALFGALASLVVIPEITKQAMTTHCQTTMWSRLWRWVMGSQARSR